MSQTVKPISTISYNTEAFLTQRLAELKKAGIISYAMFIRHKGELRCGSLSTEEDREKDHYHVYIMPAKKVDLDDLREMFNEVDATNPKPLGVMHFNLSKVGHWLGYGVHNLQYLIQQKPQEAYKEFTYKLSDVQGVGIDSDNIRQLWQEETEPLIVTKAQYLYDMFGGQSQNARLAIGCLGAMQGIALVRQVHQETLERLETVARPQNKDNVIAENTLRDMSDSDYEDKLRAEELFEKGEPND